LELSGAIKKNLKRAYSDGASAFEQSERSSIIKNIRALGRFKIVYTAI
jgi:hypothetical protein